MPKHPKKTAPHERCHICKTLADEEHGYQKGGQPQYNAFIPLVADKLEVVIDFKPHSDRKRILQRCPACKTWYLYESDYEFIVPGSEDEQTLTRITNDQAAEILKEQNPK